MAAKVSDNPSLLSTGGVNSKYDIYLVGLPSQHRPQSDDEAANDIEHQHFLRSLIGLVPEARVFEFGLFRAGTTSSKNALSANSFAQEAHILLDAIRAKTSIKKEWTTVLLVGYGLGGIVVKQALALANSSPRYYDVAVRTSDVVFISTPHTAPSLDIWESLLDKMISANGIKLRGWKTRILSAIAALVESTVSEFYCIASRYHISNFFDQASLDLLVDELSEKNFALTGDDVAVNLTTNNSSEAQEILRDSLAPSRLLKTDSWSSEDSSSDVLRADYFDCLQLIAPSRWLIYEANSVNLVGEAVDSKMYDDQIKDLNIDATPRPNSIHIIGPPGHGKWTLMKLLTQRIRRQSQNAVVLDLLAGSSLTSSLSTESILLSLAHQLLSQVPSLFRCIRNFYVDHAKEQRWSGHTIWTFISELLRHNKNSKVIILSSNINDLTPEITKLSRRLLLYLSSIGANYIYISSGKGKRSGRSEFPDGLTYCATPRIIIDLWETADVSRDRLIEAKLNDMAHSHGHENVAAFKDTILENLKPFHGSFSTVTLYVMQLSQKFSLSTAEALDLGLKEWPRTEEHIYEQCIVDLEKKGPQILDWCRLAVSWTLQAQRPLRIQEFAAAVAIKERCFDIAHMQSSISVSVADDIQRHLSMILRLENQVVVCPMSSSMKRSFMAAHTTAVASKQQHAEDETEQDSEKGVEQKFPQQTFRLLSHGELATLCLEYLVQLLSNLEAEGISWPNCLAQVTWDHETWASSSPILDFLGYAATQWPAHYRLADADIVLDTKVLEVLNNLDLVTKWYELYHRSIAPHTSFRPGDLTAQRIAGELNFPRILNNIQEHTGDLGTPSPNSKAVRGSDDGIIDTDALMAAAQRDDFKRIKTLIRPIAGSGKCSGIIAVALNTAAQRGCLSAVEALLQYSSVSATDEQGRTPLHQAIIGGESSIVKLLLNKDGVNTNAQDHQGRTPLILAARAGLIRLVRMLVDKHPNLNLADENGWTALHYAVHDGEKMVAILLQHGADPEILNKDSESALLMACGLGHINVAKKLIDALDKKPDARVNISAEESKSPLQAAADGGHLEIVKLLLMRSDDSSVKEALNESLIAAASSGHVAIVKQLLAKIDPEDDSNARQKALYHASGAGHALVVGYLLDEGVQSDLQASEESPIDFATQNDHVEVVRALIRHSKDVDAEYGGDYSPLSAIVSKGWTDVVMALLNKGADPNYLDRDRKTPLHVAAECGHMRIATILISRGAFVNSRTRDRLAALHLAVKYPDMVRLLLSSGAEVDPQDQNGETPLHYAIERGFDETVDILLGQARLDVRSDLDETPLHFAIKYGSHAMLRKIWARKSDEDEDIFRSSPPILLAAETRNLDALDFLLNEKLADIHATNKSGDTALHAAVLEGHEDVVAVLLKRGAEVNRLNKVNQTPLHHATMGVKDKGHIVSMLLSEGADWAREDQNQTTALHMAADWGKANTVKVLLEAMFKENTTEKDNLINKQNSDGRTPLSLAANSGVLETVKLLIENHADMNKPDSDGRTPLFRAAYRGNLEIVTNLVENKADVNIANNDGWTPLHAGADNLGVAKILLNHGANVNTPDNAGWTPLMRAAYWEKSEAVKMLLEFGADVNCHNQDKRTALHIALAEGVHDIVVQLLEAGIHITEGRETVPGYLEIAAAREDGKILLETLLKQQDQTKEELWCMKDRIAALWKAYDKGYIDNITCILGGGKNGDVINSRSSEGYTLLEAALLDGKWSWVTKFLDLGVDPFLRPTSGGASAFEMIPMYPFRQERIDLFHSCLDKLDTNLTVLGDGFRGLRIVLEMSSKAGWDKLKPLYKSASSREDDDGWMLNHFLYHLGGDTVWWVDPVPKLPEKKTHCPTRLESPRSWLQRRRVPDFEITSNLEVVYKEYTSDQISVRADHALPPRDMGLSYFEAKILKYEGSDNTDSGTIAGIGLCGEFNDLRDSWPGWSEGTVGYHGDGFIMEDGSTVTYPQTYSEGDTIGCGVNGKKGTYYFTLNGKVIYSGSNKLVYRKQYPVITMSTVPCTIKVNFGPEGFEYDPVEGGG